MDPCRRRCISTSHASPTVHQPTVLPSTVPRRCSISNKLLASQRSFSDESLRRPSLSNSEIEAIDIFQKKFYHTMDGISTNRRISESLSLSQCQDVISDKSADQPSKICTWLKFHRKRLGFRHIFLSFLVVLYTMFGAGVFYWIEGTNERSILHVREEKLDELLDHLGKHISETVNNPNKTVTSKEMTEFIKESYIELQKHEEQYKWSTFYKLEDANNMKWTFTSSIFFSMNIYTTTGYGNISAETIPGQVFTIFYAFCFVPLTMLVLRDLGQLFLVNFTRLYILVCRRREGIELTNIKNIKLPIFICFSILVVYLMFATTFVYLYDALTGPEFRDGISYFTSFYFSFISLTTIGLGDVTLNNVPFAPPVSIIFFIGMAVTKVVNQATYLAVEKGVFVVITMAENRIDALFNYQKVEDRQSSVRSDARSIVTTTTSVYI